MGIEKELNSLLSTALDKACEMIGEGECPMSLIGVEPWGDCHKVCEDELQDYGKCWRKFFINKSDNNGNCKT